MHLVDGVDGGEVAAQTLYLVGTSLKLRRLVGDMLERLGELAQLLDIVLCHLLQLGHIDLAIYDRHNRLGCGNGGCGSNITLCCSYCCIGSSDIGHGIQGVSIQVRCGCGRTDTVGSYGYSTAYYADA